MELAIETDSAELIEALGELVEGQPSLIGERHGMDGVTLTTIIITLTPPILLAVTKLIEASIAARRHVRVIKDGVTIEGVSERTLLKLLSDE